MKIKIIPILCLVLFMWGCKDSPSEEVVEELQATNVEIEESPFLKEGMVKITIMYPNGVDTTFDMDYYANKHMPMVDSLLGDAMKGFKIDKGISGRTAEDPLPYMAIGYLYFESIDAYEKAFAPHADAIVGDIPNYTNVQPTIQIGEIVK